MPRAKKDLKAQEKYLDQQAKMAYEHLVSQQSAQKAAMASITAALLLMIVFMLIVSAGLKFVWLFFISAWFIGHLSAQFGKVFERKLALIPAIAALVSHAVLTLSLAALGQIELDALNLAMIPLSFFSAFYGGVMELNQIQRRALWRKELGRI
ncbi:hypothetical protein G3R49_07815 [Shewanella sp. WXL01]|uniref:hypothetical protein n=1 Tax=Shewanella sp. WXL01 TaxID=2709721 RepID=UPI001438401A|nr:hypothetical protein [Shewanella sp. WXL01]NKF50476.1 hypothetical protein [Shewanella sp. WXL01]